MATLSAEAEKEIGGIVEEKLKGFKPSPDPATATKAEFEAFMKGAFKEAIDKINEQKDLIEQLSSQNDEMAGKLNAQTIQKNDPITLSAAIRKAYADNLEEIQKVVKSGGKMDRFIVLNVGTKAAVDLTTANTIGAGDTQYILTENTGKISKIRQREERYLNVAAPGSIGSPRALWVEETDEQGVPVFIAEGETKTRVSVKYIEKTKEVQKIAVYSKVTTEMLADLPQLISFIQNNMTKRLSVKTEDQLVDGDGVGENLKGLTAYATDFSAGALAGAIENANELDVIRAVALQVELAYGIGNALFIHPSDWAKIQLIKSEDKRPLWKDYEVAGTGKVIINGMEIIPTTAMTAGEFAGGDMSVVNVLFREGLTVQIGMSGDDLINNKKTIVVEQRLVQFVSANDTGVLVKGDFTTAKAALNAA